MFYFSLNPQIFAKWA